jgi:hypothetical protein
MKYILAFAIASTGFVAAPAALRANDCYYQPTYHCAPTYVSTKEVCRRTECRWATNYCGNRYSYQVVVITYADYYSDGSSKQYSRTTRA